MSNLTWQHDGKNVDGSAFDATQFNGWQLEVNDTPVASVPIGWKADGRYSLPLDTLGVLTADGNYKFEMRLAAKNGALSDWSAPYVYAHKRKPSAPFGLSVA